MTHINKATTPATPSNACLLPERCVHVLYGDHCWKNWLGSGNGDAACSVWHGTGMYVYYYFIIIETCFVHQRFEIGYLCQKYTRILLSRPTNSQHIYIYIHTECPGRNVPDFGRMFLTLKYTDITQNSCIRSWTVTEIMAREKSGLLAVPRTVPVSRVVTRTLRIFVLQSHSRVKHIPRSLSTDVTVTVNCNSILLDIHVPCKVFGTLRTTATLVPVFM